MQWSVPRKEDSRERESELRTGKGIRDKIRNTERPGYVDLGKEHTCHAHDSSLQILK